MILDSGHRLAASPFFRLLLSFSFLTSCSTIACLQGKHATTVAVTLTAAAVLSHHTPVAVRVAVTAAAVSRFAWTAEPSMAPLLCVNTY
ncbi:hypothetical protein BC827DRAFT_1223310 [Russula dissimulans]|nr:hypothetical protein BC827DRAFT_1223310 [Russula dissimulans]